MSNKNGKVKKEESEGLGVLAVFAVGIGLLAIYHFLVAAPTAAQANEGAASNIVVVDSKAVLEAFMKATELEIQAGKDLTEEEVRMTGARFGAEYLRAVKKYRDAGFLVIDKKYALGIPKGAEITSEIGKVLNLDVAVTPDPFAAPEIE